MLTTSNILLLVGRIFDSLSPLEETEREGEAIKIMSSALLFVLRNKLFEPPWNSLRSHVMRPLGPSASFCFKAESEFVFFSCVCLTDLVTLSSDKYCISLIYRFCNSCLTWKVNHLKEYLLPSSKFQFLNKFFPSSPLTSLLSSFSISFYYEFSKEQDYICSKPDDSGMHLCDNLPPFRIGAQICNGEFTLKLHFKTSP